MKMQRAILKKIQLGATLNPLKDAGHVPAVDEESNLENLYSKVDKIGEFWQSGKADEKLARYIPNVTEVSRQNRIAGNLPRKAYALRHIRTKQI